MPRPNDTPLDCATRWNQGAEPGPLSIRHDIAALLGGEEEALALLGEAADVYLPFWLHRDEAWEAMLGKPEIQRMMVQWEEPHPTDEIALFDRCRWPP